MNAFSSSPLALGSIANAITGPRQVGHLQVDLPVLRGQHVAGAGLLELGHRADVAGAELVGVVVLLALGHQQLADALLADGARQLKTCESCLSTPW